jgi:hypothetical protein
VLLLGVGGKVAHDHTGIVDGLAAPWAMGKALPHGVFLFKGGHTLEVLLDERFELCLTADVL